MTSTLQESASGVFDADQAKTLLDSDRQHWWFQAKASIVRSVIADYASVTRTQGWLVDLGSGAGGVTALLGWPPGRTLAVDGFAQLVEAGRMRHGFRASVGTGEHAPVRDGSVDVVTLLDVIEHLEEPRRALDEARRILKPDGLLVVTVPAHQWLWSGADELLGHVRRYNRPLLRGQLMTSGFSVIRCSHIFSWLVPPVWLQRRLTADKERQLGLEASSPLLDRVARGLTSTEWGLARRRSLPLGTSVVALGRPTR